MKMIPEFAAVRLLFRLSRCLLLCHSLCYSLPAATASYPLALWFGRQTG